MLQKVEVKRRSKKTVIIMALCRENITDFLNNFFIVVLSSHVVTGARDLRGRMRLGKLNNCQKLLSHTDADASDKRQIYFC